MIRDGSALVRTGDAVVMVHVRNADAATTQIALQRLADLAARSRTPDPAG